MGAQVIADQMKLRAQRELKLRRRNEAKENSLEKAEWELIQANIWYERNDSISWKIATQVTR